MPSSRDELRYEQLKQSITDIGLIRRGSVVKRLTYCGKPGCRCQADPPKPHGPYYQWTRKIRGKTVTVRITREQAALMKAWIANGRQLTKLIAQMEKVSLRVTDRTLREARD